MSVHDYCRFCKEYLRINGNFANTRKVFEVARFLNEKSVFERLKALGLTLRKDNFRSIRTCKSCFRLIKKMEDSFAVFNKWHEDEIATRELATTPQPRTLLPKEPVEIKVEKQDLSVGPTLSSPEPPTPTIPPVPIKAQSPKPPNIPEPTTEVPPESQKQSEAPMSSGHQAVIGGPAGKVSSSSVMSGSTNWDSNPGMDGITVVRIDDTHIEEEQSNVMGKVREGATAYYEMEYSMPADDEVAVEEEDDGVYVIEYSNPEEEGQSYQFTMSVDRSLPPKKPTVKHPMVRESARAPLPVRIAPRPPLPVKPISTQPQKMMPVKRKLVEEDVKKEEIVSNKCVLELGEDYNDVMKMNDGKSLVCSLCPPPGRRFKKPAGLAVHLKSLHHLEGRKTFFCTWCQLPVRSQIILDTHTKRHVNAETVFTCKICSEKSENNPEAEEKSFRGSKWAMKKHMEKEHPGILPSCDFCNKNFKTVDSYLADQFRHIGVTPHYCARCNIYEITERGLNVHIKNHDKPKKRMPEPGETPPTPSVPAATADNSATDDSDF